ncbi:MAG: HNH endonuclease [Thermogutta sp.]|nr:HNH endonuclease [Thermogutta sp.]
MSDPTDSLPRRRDDGWEVLLRRIDSQLRELGAPPGDEDLREKVLRLVRLHRSLRKLGLRILDQHGVSARAAIERLRLYFLRYPQTVIDGAELAVVAGISEYARRVRQLRVEHGYLILTGARLHGEEISLRPNQYFLIDTQPDPDAARRWHVANRIRRLQVGARERVLRYLLENVGKPVTTEELAYAARGAKEYARRVRELRTEEGFPIATCLTGRPDLKPGQYVLLSADRVAQEHDRHIPESEQRKVYARDGNACRICGWRIQQWREQDPRILELYHLTPHARGGENAAENLVVLCSRCHDEVHQGKHGAFLERLGRAIGESS